MGKTNIRNTGFKLFEPVLSTKVRKNADKSKKLKISALIAAPAKLIAAVNDGDVSPTSSTSASSGDHSSPSTVDSLPVSSNNGISPVTLGAGLPDGWLPFPGAKKEGNMNSTQQQGGDNQSNASASTTSPSNQRASSSSSATGSDTNADFPSSTAPDQDSVVPSTTNTNDASTPSQVDTQDPDADTNQSTADTRSVARSNYTSTATLPLLHTIEPAVKKKSKGSRVSVYNIYNWV